MIRNQTSRAIKSICAAFLLTQCSLTFAAADTIFFGGPIVTVNANNDEVEALAVKD